MKRVVLNPMELYHFKVYMPLEIIQAARQLERRAATARFSFHTQEWLEGSASNDALRLHKHRFSSRNLRETLLRIARMLPTPFEVGVSNGRVFKYAVRLPLDADNDITVVVGANNVVRTAWINSKEDQHRSLDTSKYVPNPNV